MEPRPSWEPTAAVGDFATVATHFAGPLPQRGRAGFAGTIYDDHPGELPPHQVEFNRQRWGDGILQSQTLLWLAIPEKTIKLNSLLEHVFEQFSLWSRL